MENRYSSKHSCRWNRRKCCRDIRICSWNWGRREIRICSWNWGRKDIRICRGNILPKASKSPEVQPINKKTKASLKVSLLVLCAYFFLLPKDKVTGAQAIGLAQFLDPSICECGWGGVQKQRHWGMHHRATQSCDPVCTIVSFIKLVLRKV